MRFARGGREPRLCPQKVRFFALAEGAESEWAREILPATGTKETAVHSADMEVA